jgi:hypothetical protein
MNAKERKLLDQIKQDRDEWRQLAIRAINVVQVSAELIENINTKLNNVLAELEG